jgi:N-acetylglucosaminyldiphosphoundecaprenol N-acetyl-beta-D-mannosaminyltransferase
MSNPVPAIAQLPHVDILGNRVHLIDTTLAVDYIEDWIAHPRECPARMIVTGFHGLHCAMEDPDFKTILDQAELFVPDGIAPVWIARRLGKDASSRVTGVDLMRCFFERAEKRGYSSYFFGDTEETLDKLRINIESEYPNHKVAGMYSPPFRTHSEEEKQRMIDDINQARPDVLWVGLGLPKQERWIHENLHQLKVPVAIGVGAAFGFHSGQVRRVPEWAGNAGFEWVWRFLAEPKKLWRRDVIDGPRFLYKIGINWLRIRKENQ